MHLLNVHTLRLEHFIDGNVPDYAILSHTWGETEATFQDYAPSTPLLSTSGLRQSRRHLTKKKRSFQARVRIRRGLHGAGHAKTRACCNQAKLDGLKYAWIDTCCIDKSSSAELSEAINSMFQYYRSAAVCYVFLIDVRPVSAHQSEGHHRSELEAASSRQCNDMPSPRTGHNHSTRREPFFLTEQLKDLTKSRWFTRGWTLQELIAASFLQFFDSTWSLFGWSRSQWRSNDVNHPTLSRAVADGSTPQITNLLADITGIPTGVLLGDSVASTCVSDRMRWAKNRRTTRPEDIAYCLLGIFGINMPLLYGEGSNAFVRLQQEILKQSRDHSIFAFETHHNQPVEGRGFEAGANPLAQGPEYFTCDKSLVLKDEKGPATHYTMTNAGVQINLPIMELCTGEALVALSCTTTDVSAARLCLILIPSKRGGNEFYRRHSGSLTLLPSTYFNTLIEHSFSHRQIYLAPPPSVAIISPAVIHIKAPCSLHFRVQRTYPPLRCSRDGMYHTDSITNELIYTHGMVFLQCFDVTTKRKFVINIRLSRERPWGNRQTFGRTNYTGIWVQRHRYWWSVNSSYPMMWTGNLAVMQKKTGLSMAEVMLSRGKEKPGGLYSGPEWLTCNSLGQHKLSLHVHPDSGLATISIQENK